MLSEDLLYANLYICPIVIEYLKYVIDSVLKSGDAAVKCCQKLWGVSNKSNNVCVNYLFEYGFFFPFLPSKTS